MLYQYKIKTKREEFLNVTSSVRQSVQKSGCVDGVCVVYCAHTTAGMTINENADPNVARDMLLALDDIYCDRAEFRHAEGNSSAHLKASFVGSSVCVPISDARLVLGTWQGIYFCEFDGPRNRNYYIQIISSC